MSPRVTPHKEGRLSFPPARSNCISLPFESCFLVPVWQTCCLHPSPTWSFCWGSSSLSHLPCCNLWQGGEMRHRKAVLLVFIGLRPYWHKWWARGGGWGPPRAGDKPDPDTKPQAGVCPISLPEPCSIYIERFEELCFYLALKVHFKSIKKRSHWVRQPHLGNSNSMLSFE